MKRHCSKVWPECREAIGDRGGSLCNHQLLLYPHLQSCSVKGQRGWAATRTPMRSIRWERQGLLQARQDMEQGRQPIFPFLMDTGILSACDTVLISSFAIKILRQHESCLRAQALELASPVCETCVSH